jgi:hypothetical protein
LVPKRLRSACRASEWARTQRMQNQSLLHHQARSPIVEHAVGSTHGYARCAPSLSRIGAHAMCSLSYWGYVRCAPSLSHMQLGGPMHMLSRAGTAVGGARCSCRRKRRGAQQEEAAWGAATHTGRCNSM